MRSLIVHLGVSENWLPMKCQCLSGIRVIHKWIPWETQWICSLPVSFLDFSERRSFQVVGIFLTDCEVWIIEKHPCNPKACIGYWIFHIYVFTAIMMFPHLGYGSFFHIVWYFGVAANDVSLLPTVLLGSSGSTRTLKERKTPRASRLWRCGLMVMLVIFTGKKTIFSSENPHFCPIPMFSGEDKCFWFYHILGTVLYHRGFHWIPSQSQARRTQTCDFIPSSTTLSYGDPDKVIIDNAVISIVKGERYVVFRNG